MTPSPRCARAFPLRALCSLLLAAALATPTRAAAQQESPPHRPAVSWMAVGESAVLVAAAFPLDGAVRSWIRGAPQQSAAVDGVTDVITPWGAQVPFVAGAILFGAAKALHHPGFADALWHSGEGTVAAATASLVLKEALHRARPYVASKDADDFFQARLLSTDSRWESFPSGHTTVAFAVAGAASEEVEVHWPRHARLAEVTLYGLATGVAFARVYDDKHWTSDVVAGAALGTLVGRAVVRHAHGGAREGAGALLSGLVVVPGKVPFVGFGVAAP